MSLGMEIERARQVVTDIAYKPGWQIRIFASSFGLYLQVHLVSPNSGTGDLESWSGRKWLLSPHMTNGEIVQTALMAVLAAEEHEAREFFRYKGQMIFGPHFNLEKLLEICEGDATEVRKTA